MMFMMRDTNPDPPNPAFMGADKTPRPPADAPRWVIVVPVKSTTRAKTRLVTEPEGLIDNAALAAAFAYDTVEAALTSDQVRLVLVVTDDLELSEGMRELGAVVVQEDTELPIESPGFARLNEAITYGEDVARFAHDARFVAVLTGDLPALKGDELSAVLTEASHYQRSFVADSTGIGTALLAAGPASRLDPRFGYDSAASHLSTGAAPIKVAARSVRSDIDTLLDLHEAAGLGLGTRTALLLAEYSKRANSADLT